MVAGAHTAAGVALEVFIAGVPSERKLDTPRAIRLSALRSPV
jgi:hypothetical protein